MRLQSRDRLPMHTWLLTAVQKGGCLFRAGVGQLVDGLSNVLLRSAEWPPACAPTWYMEDMAWPLSEWVSERASESVSECVSERVSERVSECVSERVGE